MTPNIFNFIFHVGKSAETIRTHYLLLLLPLAIVHSHTWSFSLHDCYLSGISGKYYYWRLYCLSLAVASASHLRRQRWKQAAEYPNRRCGSQFGPKMAHLNCENYDSPGKIGVVGCRPRPRRRITVSSVSSRLTTNGIETKSNEEAPVGALIKGGKPN